jgi:TolB-like protein
MPDVFLSYNREDAAVAKLFADAFAREGLEVWWDVTLRSGETYDEVTEAALRNAKAVVVLWSPRSVASHWVRAEATIAHRARTLVPATIEPCDKPVMFELTQTAELSHWRGDDGDSTWHSFLGDVRRRVGGGKVPMGQDEGFQAPVGPKPPSRSARPAIAVLPFVNRSGLPACDILAEGIAEDIIGALSASLWLRVIASSATVGFRSEAQNLRQLGQSLGVRYLLEGNLRKVGNVLRVAAQLIHGESGDIIWTQKFDRPLAQIDELQDELVEEVVAYVAVQLRRAEVEHALEKSDNLTPWEAFARALSSGEFQTREGYESSVRELKKASVQAQNDGLAYAVLAAQQGQLLHLSGGDDPALEKEIVENIKKARKFDPNKPDILIWLAAALIGLRRLDDALPLAERAVAMRPNDDYANHMLGGVLARLGRVDEAIAHLNAGDRLGPGGYWSYIGSLNRSIAYVIAGQYEQALETIDPEVRVLPGPELLIQTMLCRAKLDMWEHARDDMRQLRDIDAGMSRTTVEGVVHSLYCGADLAQRDNQAATIRKLWDETEGGET